MPTGGESMIALEQLDSHIKAILKLKLRAFVHLNPCFENTHSIDMDGGRTNPLRTPPVLVPPLAVPSVLEPAVVSETSTQSVAEPPYQMFPPIPEKDFVVSTFCESEPHRIAEPDYFAPNLPLSHDYSAQPGDCPNRLQVTRMRRRARV